MLELFSYHQWNMVDLDFEKLATFQSRTASGCAEYFLLHSTGAYLQTAIAFQNQ